MIKKGKFRNVSLKMGVRMDKQGPNEDIYFLTLWQVAGGSFCNSREAKKARFHSRIFILPEIKIGKGTVGQRFALRALLQVLR